MTQLLDIKDGKVIEYQPQKFKFKATSERLTFGSDGYFGNSSQEVSFFINEEHFYSTDTYSHLSFKNGLLNHAAVYSNFIVALSAQCDKF